MPRLRRARPDAGGITRSRAGRGFAYTDAAGATVPRGAERDRIAALAIPPAWHDVWISPHANDHIQATGIDDAGRRQYIYHPGWRERMDQRKFERMLDLARALPAARRMVARDLALDGYPRERVLAGAFRLLDVGSVRPGSDTYTDQYGSFGLTTLRGSHATVHQDGTIELRFQGKSGQPWHLHLPDAGLADLLAGLKRRGGRARLFSWRDADGGWHPITPEEINAYVRERTHGEFTAKDFRTLTGTGVAALSLARFGEVSGEPAQRRAIAAAMRDVAAALANTASIARKSYVDPRVIEFFSAGRTIDPSGKRAIESELLALLGDP